MRISLPRSTSTGGAWCEHIPMGFPPLVSSTTRLQSLDESDGVRRWRARTSQAHRDMR